jgi:hypothetical protein
MVMNTIRNIGTTFYPNSFAQRKRLLLLCLECWKCVYVLWCYSKKSIIFFKTKLWVSPKTNSYESHIHPLSIDSNCNNYERVTTSTVDRQVLVGYIFLVLLHIFDKGGEKKRTCWVSPLFSKTKKKKKCFHTIDKSLLW